jgi:hypothetical protein
MSSWIFRRKRFLVGYLYGDMRERFLGNII